MEVQNYAEKYQQAQERQAPVTFTATVHLIEARGLPPTKEGGHPNPFCVVSVCGRRHRTVIQRSTPNCLWDLTFSFPNLTLSQRDFRRENIYVQVFNANTWRRNELIGQYAFSLARVNAVEKDEYNDVFHEHQLRRQWVALTNPDDPTIGQGFVLATVTVLRAGDRPPSFASDADGLGGGGENNRSDNPVSASTAGGLDPARLERQLLRPPTLRRRGYNLTVNIWRAEHFPDLSGPPTTFIVVKFNGMTMRTEPEPRTAFPEWNQRLVFPVYTPCMNNNVDVQVWTQHRLAPDTMLASAQLSFNMLLNKDFGPLWMNLYGAPPSTGGSAAGFWGWLGDTAPNNVNEPGRRDTAYLGRLLLQLHAAAVAEPARMEVPVPSLSFRSVDTYVLRTAVFRGSEFELGHYDKVMVEVCFGSEDNARRTDWSYRDEAPRSTKSKALGAGEIRKKKRQLGRGKRARLPNSRAIHFISCEKDAAYVAPPSLYSPGFQQSVPRDAQEESERAVAAAEAAQQCTFRDVVVELPDIREHRSEEILRESFYHIVVNVYVQGMSGRRRVGFLRFHPLDFWTNAGASWSRPRARWFRIEGISDASGQGFVPAAVPGFLFMDIKFGRYVDANAPATFVDTPGGVLFDNRTPSSSMHALANGTAPGAVPTKSLKPSEHSGFLAGVTAARSVQPTKCAYDLYVHVFQGANMICPLKFRAPDTFLEVDLNGRLAKNITYDTDSYFSVGEVTAGSESSTRADGSDSDDQDGISVDERVAPEAAEETELFRTTVRRAEVNPVWYETLCIRDILGAEGPASLLRRDSVNGKSSPIKPHSQGASKNSHNDFLRPQTLADLDNIRVTINGAERSSRGSTSSADTFKHKYVIGVVYVAPGPCVCDTASMAQERWFAVAPSTKRVRPAALGQVLLQFQVIRRDISEGALPPPPVHAPWYRQQLQRFRVQLGCYKLLKVLESVPDSRVTLSMQASTVPSHVADSRDYVDENGSALTLQRRDSVKIDTRKALVNHILTIDVMMPPHQRPSCIPWIVIALHKGHHAAVLSDRKPFFAVLAMPLHAVLEEELSFGGPVARELPGRDGAENTPSLISRVSLNVGRVGDEAVVADGSMFLSLRTADMNCEFDPELSQTRYTQDIQLALERESSLQPEFERVVASDEFTEIEAISVFWPHERPGNAIAAGEFLQELPHELEASPLFRPILHAWALRNRDGVAIFRVRGVLSTYKADLNRLVDSGGTVTNEWPTQFTTVDERLRLFAALGDQGPDFTFWPARLIAAPRSIKVRVYVKSAHSLVPSLTGRAKGQRSGSAPIIRAIDPPMKPYLRLSIEHSREDQLAYPSHVFSTADRHFATGSHSEPSLNPEFYKMFELDCIIPNLSRLSIELYDAKFVGGVDEFVGATHIDLEERWHNDNWRAALQEKRVPVEYRTLYYETPNEGGGIGGVPQGKLEMWIEMYPRNAATRVPYYPIGRRRPQWWELRVVIWDSKGILGISPTGGADNNTLNERAKMNLFFVVEYQDGRSRKEDSVYPDLRRQETMVYHNARAGRAEFNYRCKFRVKIPGRFPRLKVQVWEKRNHLSLGNRFLGESALDVTEMFRQAQAQNTRVDYDRAYISMSHPDYPGVPRGKVGMQLSLVTEKFARKFPVGYGQDAPNEDPFLPRIDAEREGFWANLTTVQRILVVLGIIVLVTIIIVVVVYTQTSQATAS